MQGVTVNAPLSFPCGRVMKNRIAKAAMTECLCDPCTGAPNDLLYRLYRTWGGMLPGMLITGNTMVDSRYRESSRNLIVEDKTHFEEWKKFAAEAKKGAVENGGEEDSVLMIGQISHSGRQTPMSVSFQPVAPSVTKLIMRGAGTFFFTPRELTSAEIEDAIARFATSASILEEAGFDGVELHSAHGYLISQFLSPLTNKRTDKWGGTHEKRTAFLKEIIRSVRQAVSPSFIVGIKLNSADFQKGGFSEDDCADVLQWIAQHAKIDFVEISGGSYEAAEMMKESTQLREAFFAAFSRRAKKIIAETPGCKTAIMLTGGFRSTRMANTALSKNDTDIVGIGRPFAVNLNVVKRLLTEEDYEMELYRLKYGPRFLAFATDTGLQNLWHQQQFSRIGKGLQPSHDISKLYCLTVMLFRAYIWDWRYHPTRNVLLFILCLVMIVFCLYLFLF